MTTQRGTIMRIFTVGRSSMQQRLAHHRASAKKGAHSTQRLFDTHPSRHSRVTPELPPALYEQLKKEEREQFDRKRIRIDSQRNDTCALTLEFSEEQLASKLDDEDALLSMCKNYIIEHAGRRIDLFFLILTAYYQTGVLPVEGHTNFQYGIGRSIGSSGTQACHSSFTPSLLDETIFQNDGDEAKCKSLLSRTHLSQSLNATVELPASVNAFDDILEGIFRPICLVLIREVSLGAISPIEGLASLLSKMDTILHEFKQQASDEKYASLSYPDLPMHRYVNPKLIDFVIQGTLGTTYDNVSHTVNEPYLHLLLGITAEEKKLCEKSSGNRNKTYHRKIMTIQNEILVAECQESICAI